MSEPAALMGCLSGFGVTSVHRPSGDPLLVPALVPGSLPRASHPRLPRHARRLFSKVGDHNRRVAAHEKTNRRRPRFERRHARVGRDDERRQFRRRRVPRALRRRRDVVVQPRRARTITRGYEPSPRRARFVPRRFASSSAWRFARGPLASSRPSDSSSASGPTSHTRTSRVVPTPSRRIVSAMVSAWSSSFSAPMTWITNGRGRASSSWGSRPGSRRRRTAVPRARRWRRWTTPTRRGR